MICKECWKKLSQISYRHLKYCCWLTPQEYKIKHNVLKLMDDNILNKCSFKKELNPNFKHWNTFKIRKCIKCWNKITYRWKTGLCFKCSIENNKNWLWKEHSIDTKKKMSISAKVRDKTTYKHWIWDIKILSSKQKLYWANISKKDRISKLDKFIKSWLEKNKKNKWTKIEKSIENILKKLSVNYKNNIFIEWNMNVDFLIEWKERNIVIECYWDYWHCNPLFYDDDYYHKNLKMTAIEKRKKDIQREKKIKNLDYLLLIFWENDINTKLWEIENTLKSIFSNTIRQNR